MRSFRPVEIHHGGAGFVLGVDLLAEAGVYGVEVMGDAFHCLVEQAHMDAREGFKGWCAVLRDRIPEVFGRWVEALELPQDALNVVKVVSILGGKDLFEKRAGLLPQEPDLVRAWELDLDALAALALDDQVFELQFDVVAPAHQEGIDQVVLVAAGGRHLGNDEAGSFPVPADVAKPLVPREVHAGDEPPVFVTRKQVCLRVGPRGGRRVVGEGVGHGSSVGCGGDDVTSLFQVTSVRMILLWP